MSYGKERLRIRTTVADKQEGVLRPYAGRNACHQCTIVKGGDMDIEAGCPVTPAFSWYDPEASESE